jgi:hypothetical protein
MAEIRDPSEFEEPDYIIRALLAWDDASHRLFDGGDRQAAAVLTWQLMTFCTQEGYQRNDDWVGFKKVGPALRDRADRREQGNSRNDRAR